MWGILCLVILAAFSILGVALGWYGYNEK